MDAVQKIPGTDRFRTTVAEGETPRTKPAADPYLAATTLETDLANCPALEDLTHGAHRGRCGRLPCWPSPRTPVTRGPATRRAARSGAHQQELRSAGL
ncbi:hypothetical protein AB0N62_35580 [Streptomyces sp. NPDC093982]|uniref:hypothetical protein n=1 Tax=Streptomyces sp. NPDC093982 TaxID=3155077 RepID=UPI003421B3B9